MTGSQEVRGSIPLGSTKFSQETAGSYGGFLFDLNPLRTYIHSREEVVYSFDRFKRSHWSLVVIRDSRIIFRSKASAIKPLIRFIESGPVESGKLTVYDKYVGRAAALLIVLIKPVEVQTPVISEGGREVLEKYEIPFQAERDVKYLMGIASDDMCKWEKMTIGKSPDEFWGLLTEK